MLVLSPLREPREIGKNLFRVRMENVGTILVNQDAVLIIAVVRVSSNVVPAVDEQHLFVHAARDAFGNDAAREPRPDYEIVIHRRGWGAWLAQLPSLTGRLNA